MSDTTNESAPFDDENGCVKKKSNGHVWKFVHHENFNYQTDILKGRSCDFNWLRIDEDGTITVKGSHDRGYAWDGCTPKLNFLHITWGNFDGLLIKHGESDYKPYTYYASMVHDVLYQYKRCALITRAEADKIFLHMLRKSGFMWSYMYYLGVRSLGWMFRGWKYKRLKKK